MRVFVSIFSGILIALASAEFADWLSGFAAVQVGARGAAITVCAVACAAFAYATWAKDFGR